MRQNVERGRACGHGGSCARYLYHTVTHLEKLGIHDRNLWKLQELVADEIQTSVRDTHRIEILA